MLLKDRVAASTYLLNSVCVCVTESKSERPMAARARSPDIIEDDISDYPKDTNLSLSVIYFNCFIPLHSNEHVFSLSHLCYGYLCICLCILVSPRNAGSRICRGAI